jgi:sodium/hydrogen exchanger 8
MFRSLQYKNPFKLAVNAIWSKFTFGDWLSDLLLQVFGTATKPLIGWLLPAHLKTLYHEDSDPPSPKDISVDSDIHVPLLLGVSEAVQEHNGGNFIINGLRRPSSITALLGASTSGIHRVWRNFDDACMRPLFGGRGFVRQVSRRPTIPEDEPFEDSNSEE